MGAPHKKALSGCILNQYNETSCFQLIKLVTEYYFEEHANITTKLKQKLFTKVIKMSSKEALFGINRESN